MKLAILDRDGVINEDSDDYIKSPAEWRPLAGSLDAITRLKNAGYKVVIASNQSGIGRGFFDHETLAAIHAKMNTMLADRGTQLDGVFYCPHTPDDNCDCRKPRTGLLDRIAWRFNTTLAGVPFIGDSARDIEAARAAGAQPILVLTGKGRRVDRARIGTTPCYADLAAAVDAILRADAARLTVSGQPE